MSVTSYATSESYQNGIEVKRGECDETIEGGLRLPLLHPFDVMNARLAVGGPWVLRRAA